MSDKKATAPTQNDESDMIVNLDLLMNMDVVDNESNWSLFSATGDAGSSMPSDLPDLPDLRDDDKSNKGGQQ